MTKFEKNISEANPRRPDDQPQTGTDDANDTKILEMLRTSPKVPTDSFKSKPRNLMEEEMEDSLLRQFFNKTWISKAKPIVSVDVHEDDDSKVEPFYRYAPFLPSVSTLPSSVSLLSNPSKPTKETDAFSSSRQVVDKEPMWVVNMETVIVTMFALMNFSFKPRCARA